jgi:hypothetical protein
VPARGSFIAGEVVNLGKESAMRTLLRSDAARVGLVLAGLAVVWLVGAAPIWGGVWNL